MLNSCLPFGFGFVCLDEDPLKIMKSAFHLIEKALFVVKIFTFFCPNIFGHVGKWLDKKAISEVIS